MTRARTAAGWRGDGMELSALTLLGLASGLLVTGAVAGTLAGLLGVGGGIVIVPVLSWVLALIAFPPDISQHMAVATSLATIIPTAISSTRAHRARGAVDDALVRRWGTAMVAGALIGGLAARYVSGDVLRLIFGAVALIVAVNMAIPRTLVVGTSLPGGTAGQPVPLMIGLFSALMGIGGGTLAVPVQSAFSVPVHRAVGTAAAFGLLIAIPGTLGFVWAGWGRADLPPGSLGYVNLPAAAAIIPTTWAFAPLGARLAHAIDQSALKRAFALFLAITALRMLATALT